MYNDSGKVSCLANSNHSVHVVDYNTSRFVFFHQTRFSITFLYQEIMKIYLQLKIDLIFFYTEGIGDGANKLSMGKVKDIIHSDIPNGRLIVCAIALDYLLTAGVSIWGG